MSIKQVRTKHNTYNTIKYDSFGNILTPARKKELKEQAKKQPKNKDTTGRKWLKITGKYESTCCVCKSTVPVGTQILWNRNNKKIMHLPCARL